ncbi:hypothetical protein [uncultured Draconibacterium sp.]|uniref:hypothetical protein n=1 Tax=uncultured Draconibacterium sp. TaxID=1573823 RepID=UPI003216A02A
MKNLKRQLKNGMLIKLSLKRLILKAFLVSMAFVVYPLSVQSQSLDDFLKSSTDITQYRFNSNETRNLVERKITLASLIFR